MSNQALIQKNTGKIAIENLKRADGFWARFRGLMLSDPLQNNEAILISKCQQVHTHFMRYTIDIYYLDKELKVVAIVPAVKPWRFTKFYKNAYYVLETMPNVLNAQIGDVFDIK